MNIITARAHRLLDVCVRGIGDVAAQGERCMFLVPAQYTLQAEIEIMTRLNLGGTFLIDVLSPGRLQGRVFERAGQPDRVIFDERGKCMVLSEIIEQEKDNLTIYRAPAQHAAPGLAAKFSALIADFKRSGKAAADIEETLAQMDGAQRELSSSKKLADAARIYAAYESRMAGRLADAEDISREMLARMERSGVMENQHVFVYGFDMITPTFAGQLVHMASLCKSLTLALETDDNGAPDGRLYAPVNFSIERLAQLAGEKGIAIKREKIERELDAPRDLQIMEKQLFALGAKQQEGEPERIEVRAVSSMRQEAHICGARIRQLMLNGLDASEIAVVYPRGSGYSPLMESILAQYGITAYVAAKRPAGAHPLCRFVTAALRVVSQGWRAQDISECVLSGFMPLDREDADALCAYIEGMEIRGDAFKKPFCFIKGEDEEQLAHLNASREAVAAPLIALQKGLSRAKTADDTISAVLSLLETVSAFDRLDGMRAQLLDAGMHTEAEDCAQVWNLLMETLDQLHTLLEGSNASGALVLKLLESGLCALELSALPPADGAVICGEIGNVRTAEVKALFALGMNDSAGSSGSDLLTEQEREEAAEVTGAYLGMSLSERAALERLDILKALSGSKEQLILSYALADETGRALREGAAVQGIRRIWPDMRVSGGLVSDELTQMLSAPDAAMEAMSVHLSAAADGREALDERYAKAYAAISRSAQGREKLLAVTRRLGERAPRRLERTQARALYGRPVMSVSRLETFAQCPYRHFVRYGLSPQEELKPGVDRAELGTLYHQAAEQFTRALTQRPEFPDVDEAACERLMDEAAAPLIAQWRRSPLGESERGAAIARRITRTAHRAAKNIARQLSTSRFVPLRFEMVFGKGGAAPVILELADGSHVYLQGRIDRIDVLDGETKHIRVIDYKSGVKKFDPTMAYYGIQLQLLLYLAAAMEQTPDAQAAGFFYCRIADPTVKSESRIKEEIEKQIAKKLALAGVSLSDVEILRAQDERFAAMITRDGKPNALYRSSMTDREGMDAMLSFAKGKAAELAGGVFGGVIEDYPAAHGAYLACAHCDYAAVCGFDPARQGKKRLARKGVEDLR
ncbi:MAG: PD-(D/E)XK nuclease family protein [Clostridia bacterium]|nr:PD-(D/E)XK nuclease family protein [Clostridia bacterium]